MTTVGSLCTGYGGLDLAVEQVLGADLAWVCDLDPGAAALLAHNYPDAPNYHDLIANDWSTVEPVDVMTAGWPCQPWSSAGRRKGTEDDRAIWPAVADAIRTVRPRLVVLENVSAIARAGELARAVGDLAALGYVGSWRGLRAADVGAPHRRERIFIVAVLAADSAHLGHERCRDSRGRWARPQDCGSPAAHAESVGRSAERVAGGAPQERPGARRDLAAAPDAAGNGRGEGWAQSAGVVGRPDVALGRDAAPDTDGDGCEGGPERDRGPVECRLEASRRNDADGRVLPADSSVAYPDRDKRERERHEQSGRPAATGGSGVDWAGYQPAIDRWAAVVGRDAPAPTVLGKRGGPQLSPWFVEWMMGLPAGHVTDVPGLTRNQKLKLLGNGVVPQQAAHALRLLLPLVLDRAVAA